MFIYGHISDRVFRKWNRRLQGEVVLQVKTANGSRTVDLKFVDYDIVKESRGLWPSGSLAGRREASELSLSI